MTSNNKKRDVSKSALSELFQKSRGIAEQLLGQKKGAGAVSFRRRGRRAATPTSEQLEIRALLSTFMVTSTADTGAGSLRQVIDDANLNSGDDTIEFNLPDSGNQTITLI